MSPRRYDVPSLRGALWAERALRQARRGLRRSDLREVEIGAPPSLPASAERGVLGLLRRRRCTCLERAIVLQRWYAAQGSPREVVIGVRGPTDEFRAHAWLEGDPEGEAFQELMRLPAR